jgi:prophage antirepressor-like protein
MDIIRAFKLLDTEYPINIIGTPEEPLFQANQIGALLGITRLSENLRGFTDEHKVLRSTSTLGGVQEVAFLTEVGLYKILGRSRKPIASEFQDWAYKVIKELRRDGVYVLQNSHNTEKILLESINKKTKHDALLTSFDNRSVVYICKLKDSQNDQRKYIIKIGSTQNIRARMSNIAREYTNSEPILLDIFESSNYAKFERFIHAHEFIKKFYESQDIRSGTKTKETYCVNDDEYNLIFQLINNNKKRFNSCLTTEDIDNNKLIYDTEVIKLEQCKYEAEKQKNEIELKRLEYDNRRLSIFADLEKQRYQLELRKIEYENKKAEYSCKLTDNYVLENPFNNFDRKCNQPDIFITNEARPLERALFDKQDTIVTESSTNIQTNDSDKIELNSPITNEEFENNDSDQIESIQPITNEEFEDNDSDIDDNAVEVPYVVTNFEVKKRTNNHLIPKVYKYDPNNLTTPIKIYDSPIEVERENPMYSQTSLKRASKDNTIYKDFRWKYVNRNETPPEKIEDTAQLNSLSTEVRYIAMIDPTKTYIVKVFANQKIAAKERNMKSPNFSRAITQQSMSSEHYWNYYDKCSEEMKSEYLSREKLPEPYIPVSGTRIQQLNPSTNDILKTYGSKRDVLRAFQMSNLTLTRLIKTGEIYNGYRWKEVTN